ncbi:MAG TPA: UDP-forming cellulose synthase catalytic subunit [Acidobacteriaceae bacterium]|nr:UDP-forming cellulose synthase catalytic subunit [Acidobacteriaceae bacterium]
MTRSPLWREFESSDAVLPRLLRFLIVAGGTLFLLASAAVPLPWPQQAMLGGLLVLSAIWLHRGSGSYLTTLMLVLLSCFATVRYGIWRVHTVEKYFRFRDATWSRLDAFFVVVVLAAEAYAFAALMLGYFQTLWPLRRTPVPLPDDPEKWPEVDLLITTYNEPLRLVKYTALAATNIDWPEGKLNVYLLDDGRREEFRAFAEEAGIGYMTRAHNEHAKAGNINAALKRLDAPFVAVFDADHVPTRSFLQLTMGWFERDLNLALLQTPQHYYSPDPFERNLEQFRHIPAENELFYGVVQDGNDLWNATSFCGSCAVLRRRALDEIGGIATETVTEDAHTSIRLQKAGWSTAYINIPQAGGLATERLSGHIRQRVRWARGMTQILRLENPLFGSGLKLSQRLCYLNSAAHFLFALPRLVFLMAPLIYLIYGGTNLPGTWQLILAYAAPHLIMLYLTHLRIQGRHRHSFWNEIYETVLAPYVLLPTIGAFLWPRKPKFNVTPKGQVLYSSFFDRRIARPFLLMLFVNFLGLLCAIPRLHLFAASNAPGWQGRVLSVPHHMYDPHHLGTIVVNVLWTIFNMMLLSVATAVAWENQQRRRAVRVNVEVPAGVVLPDGSVVQGLTGDLSSTGVRLWTGSRLKVQPGDAVRIVLPVLDGDASLPATVVRVEDESLRVQFDALSLAEDEALTMVLYSRADTWLGWDESRERDHPVRSFARIVRLAFRGLRQTILPGRRSREAGLVTSIVPLVIAAVLLPAWARTSGQDAQTTAPVVATHTDGKQTAEPPKPEAVKPGVAKPEPAKSETAKAETAKADPPKAGPAVSSKKVEADSTSAQDHPPAKPVKQADGADKPAASSATAKTGAASTTAKTGAASTTPKTAASPAAASGGPQSSSTKGGTNAAAPKTAKSGHATAKTIASAVNGLVASTKSVPAAPAAPVLAPAPATVATTPTAPVIKSDLAIMNFYRARVLPDWWRATGLAAEYPWALLILVVLESFLMAVLLRASLRRRARERLLGHI